MTIGFEIKKRQQSVGLSTINKYKGLPVANISDVMARVYGGGADLMPMHNGKPMAGAALTVKTRPGDNLMVHKALELAHENDVIVVDAGGDLSNAIIGEIMVAYAASKNLAGIVIYGAIRDSADIAQGSFPVYAAGVNHRGPYKDGPGEINVPIALGNLVIEPGDLIVGDADGVLAVPYHLVDRVYKLTLEKQKAEEEMLASIAKGTYSAHWVSAILDEKGCVRPKN